MYSLVDCNQDVVQTVVLSGSSDRDESNSKFVHILGMIHLLADTCLKVLASKCLLAGSSHSSLPIRKSNYTARFMRNSQYICNLPAMLL